MWIFIRHALLSSKFNQHVSYIRLFIQEGSWLIDTDMPRRASIFMVVYVAYSTETHGQHHYNDVVYSGADQRKHQNSASLAFVRGIRRWPVNSPHKRPVTRKMFPFDDVIMISGAEDHIPNMKFRLSINSSSPGQNGRRPTDDIFMCFVMNENLVLCFEFHWILLLRVQLTITQRWFR